MLDNWGYRYLHVGLALGYAEVDLQRHRDQKVAGLAPQPSTIALPNPIITNLYSRLDDISKLSEEQDLAVIARNIFSLKAKIVTAHQRHTVLPTDELLDDVTRIKNDLLHVLSSRCFYLLTTEQAGYYGQTELFGNAVAKKFKEANDDIKRAGNCLALGEPTACVLHLMRALEVVIHKLARKLAVTISPRDTWGGILHSMDDAIKVLPQGTAKQQRQKDSWSECRANLYHIKQAWRDPSMHNRRDYNDKEARQIIATVRVFMEQLATL